MADAYWRYGDGGQQPPAIPSQAAKRPRVEFEMSSGHDMPNLYAHQGDRTVINDIDAINASYDRYLRSAQISSLGGELGRPTAMNSELLARLHHDDLRITAVGGPDPSMATKIPPMVSKGPPGIPLPPDASNTLYVEGLPANCTRREVAHIFRPFVGYKEVRLVTKESRRPGGDQLVLCFVDFQSPAHAATAMDAIQGYEFDEHDRDTVRLRLQFARFPGARSGGGNRGRR